MTKLIRVEAFEVEHYSPSGDIHFAFMSSPENGRKQCHKWLMCRDFMSDILRAHVNEDTNYDFSSHYIFGENPPIDFNKLRLLIGSRFPNQGSETRNQQAVDDFKERVFSAKRIINLYEDMAGWDKSKITTVHHSVREKKVWLLTGPKEWMTAPHLVSMITLIMRISVNYGPLKVTKEKDLKKCWMTLLKGHKEESDSGIFTLDMDIAEYLANCEAKFPLLMKNYDKIFSDSIRQDIFSPDLENYHVGSGINSLCNYETALGELNERAKKHLGEVNNNA